MKRGGIFLSAALLALPSWLLIDHDVNAAEEEHVSKAEMKKLHQAPLPGVEGKEVIIAHFTAPPDFVGGKHSHPGPVYVYVLKGEFTVESGGETKTISAGELYAEPIDRAMLPRNMSSSEELQILVFQVGDIGKPMMIKAD